MSKFDALIIGAGPAGSTAALLLAQAGWSVAVVEKAAFPRRKVCGEYLSSTNLNLFQDLGVLEEFEHQAGPEIRRVGLFAGSIILNAKMPRLKQSENRWGRALRRETLDLLLLNQAVKYGAQVRQPYSVTSVEKKKDVYISKIKSGHEVSEIESQLVIAAHGSWEIGTLPTQAQRQPAKDADLLGFKAHFEHTGLASDLMPMVVFPGGYGGMVSCDNGFVSLSCCIRRDFVKSIRQKFPELRVGEAVQAHITNSCLGVAKALTDARLHEEWLAAGVIKPGIRTRHKDGIFLVGNAAGESHPIIAEGISMAIQSSWLLAQNLIKKNPRSLTETGLNEALRQYDREWLKAFKPRIKAAEVFANLAMSSASRTIISPLLRTFPSLLTLGARLSGKVNQLST